MVVVVVIGTKDDAAASTDKVGLGGAKDLERTRDEIFLFIPRRGRSEHCERM
jgi:hypothetical protein